MMIPSKAAKAWTRSGEGGDDYLYGGADRDWLFGGDNNDYLLVRAVLTRCTAIPVMMNFMVATE